MRTSALHVFPGRKVQFQRFALLGIEFIETPVVDRFRGTDQLDDDAFVVRQMLVDRGIDRGQLQREQDLRKEALLGPLEPAAGRRLGAAVEGLVLKPIDDPGEFKRGFEVLVNDRLSRGSDNAQERGVGPARLRNIAAFPAHYFTGCRATPSGWHPVSTKGVRCSPPAHPPVPAPFAWSRDWPVRSGWSCRG